jgi:putative transcriptional regulator
MRVLRDLRLFTKLLILVEIKSQPRIKLRDLAQKLEITAQGVSEYLKLMVNENLTSKTNGDYRLTQQGVEFLHKNMSELKTFVDSSIQNLNIINACTAIAGEDLDNGDRVSLEMVDGELVAYKAKGMKPGKASSEGQILYSAKAGEEVAIVDLKGIVEFDYGTITILELPSILIGGSRALDLDKVKFKLKSIKFNKIVVADVIGKNLFNKLRIKPDVEFSPVPAALEAAQKGLNVLLATPTDMLANTIAMIEESNSKLKKKVKYKTIPLAELCVNKSKSEI